MSQHRIGIIGGSGLYNIEGFTRQKWVKIKTPFGPPSDELLTGKLAGREVVFLPRHARGHRILPSELNHRANIWAMKKLGVAWIISVSAVGSLQKKYRPCDIVLIDQFLDRTKRDFEHTFFGRGIVAHVAFAHPICEELRRSLLQAGRDELHESQTSVAKFDGDSRSSSLRKIHGGGTYVNMEGPAFSTRAESVTNHKLGYDVIGMTNLGEAKCAREAEIAYATLAMVTDYDCWNEEHDHVTVEMIIANLMKNAATAKAIIARTLPQIPAKPNWPCHDALRNAIMTDKKLWPKKTAAALKPILKKYL
ncbi:MAG: S-methyl-5'-thioadenosine phosphorylase [Verrucomicrobia bacterium]|jgi:5'-methylthioadenosine phosphorylase|nr:S-methyl-5'-thioadenosine phosphorylase [Verrucomicrobiota bacterium]